VIVKRAMSQLRGLRGRFTLLAVVLTAATSIVLLTLAWMLVRDAAAGVPQLPPGTTVRVNGSKVDAAVLTAQLQEQAQDNVIVAGVIAFGCVVLAAGILAWALTSRVLMPLAEISATARRLSAESLDERIGPIRPRDELAQLAETIDDMLDRLANAFDAQRRFVANASHELRTPLTVIRTELDVTLSDPDADEAEYRRMAEVVRAAVQRAEHLVGALLLLARTDAAGLAAREPVDLAELDQVEGAVAGIYRKLTVRVATLDGGVTAWVYVLDGYEGGLPTAWYLSEIARAAEAAGAPADYVAELRCRPSRTASPEI